jgi:hypothetical protein
MVIAFIDAHRSRFGVESIELLDHLMSRVDEAGVALTGAGAFLPELVKAVLGTRHGCRAHVGFEKGDLAGPGVG